MKAETNNSPAGKRGSALVLVLAILVACVSMIAVVQQTLYSRSVEQRIQDNEIELRAALLLALQDAMRLWATDEDRGFDHPGEAWSSARVERSDNGVALQFQLRCAQDRFNVNNLFLPQADALPRGPWEVFNDLLATRELPPPAADLQELRRKWAEKPPVWVDPSELGTEINGPELIALPRPRTGPSRLNLNTVRPEVLQALVGSSLTPWVDLVLRSRENEALRSSSGLVNTLPPPVAAWVDPFVGVKTEIAEFQAEAERDLTRKSLRALLRRSEGGEVEVLSCHW